MGELFGNLLERFVNLEVSCGGKPEWLGAPMRSPLCFELSNRVFGGEIQVEFGGRETFMSQQLH